ncbi:aminotransferase [uncultured Erythrobacter sp.]|uniref:aminotransferase n=1 Tax=uncultured Erythrobacter sp. TaxID=263913 RepID=UPI0026195503|nr:aminotransferase [uncultured Erythrobacter sp.]
MAKAELTSRANRTLSDIDRQSFLHPFSSIADQKVKGAHVLARGSGATVTGADGRRFLDGASGLWCVNVGHGQESIIEAMTKQARELAFFHNFNGSATESVIRLADKIIDLAPDNIARVFFGNSGSDANDTNIKLIWLYNNLLGRPQKKKIIARRRGYHGVTVVAGSCTGLANVHARFDLPIPGIFHVSEADCYHNVDAGDENSEAQYLSKLLSELEDLIEREGPETIAAFIAEPVMGTGGVLIPPTDYFPQVKRLLDKHDILLVLDEVISAFGRLGDWFGADRFGVEADLITTAKGLTSGYVPMSASLIGEKIWNVFDEAADELGALGHGFTYSGHPVAAAAALANLELIETHNLVDAARIQGDRMLRTLQSSIAGHPLVGDVRGAGLMIGVELVADKCSRRNFEPALGVAKRVQLACLEHGLLARALPTNDVLGFSPPFIVSDAEIDEMTEALKQGLDIVASDLVAEGAL